MILKNPFKRQISAPTSPSVAQTAARPLLPRQSGNSRLGNASPLNEKGANEKGAFLEKNNLPPLARQNARANVFNNRTFQATQSDSDIPQAPPQSFREKFAFGSRPVEIEAPVSKNRWSMPAAFASKKSDVKKADLKKPEHKKPDTSKASMQEETPRIRIADTPNFRKKIAEVKAAAAKTANQELLSMPDTPFAEITPTKKQEREGKLPKPTALLAIKEGNEKEI